MEYPVNHHFRRNYSLQQIMSAPEMTTPALVTAQEIKTAVCIICQDPIWPGDDIVNMKEEPDMMVRIHCGFLFHHGMPNQALPAKGSQG